MTAIRHPRISSRIESLFCLAIPAIAAGAFFLFPPAAARGAAQSQSGEKTNSPAPASALPHDSHDNVTISAEAFPDADAAKRKFEKANPQKAGILAVNVIFQNDGDQAVQVDLETIQLEVQQGDGPKQQLDPMGIVQVAENIAYPGGLKEPSVSRFPLGIGGSSPDKKVQKVVDELKPHTLDGDIVPPHGRLEGCIYFNLVHEMQLAATADLYIPDVVTLPAKRPLLFFDIPLGAGTVLP
ncbi:MAG TPA: hypothetical protein VMJ93_10635 [Verrucomicrobiae bacterium]|nr:hypothetical protein [Verrucomicrobiae bacterium]